VKGQYRIVGVVFAVEKGGKPQVFGLLGENPHIPEYLLGHGGVLFLLAQLHHDLQVVGAVGEFAMQRELVFDKADLLIDRLGVLQIVPEIRRRHFRGQFSVLILQKRQVQRVSRIRDGLPNG